MEFELYQVLTVVAILVLAGVCATKISAKLNIPVLLMFLLVGILAGSDRIGFVHFENAAAANVIGSIALAFILFSGGYDTRWRSIKSVIGYGSVLSSLGVLLTAVAVGCFACFVLGFPFAWSLLLGSAISSTDAAAVFAILRSKSVSLEGKLSPLLEYESGSNDPMAAFLTIFMVGFIQLPLDQQNAMAFLDIIPNFIQKMVIGIAFGYLVARAAVWLFNKIELEYDGLYYVLGIGVVLLTFGGCEWLTGNGFMAVYVAGLVLGNSNFIYQRGLGRFHDGVSWLMQVVLFVTLGLLVFIPPTFKELLPIVICGLAIALFLMFVARPLAVFLCMIGSKFNFRERLFVSWVGLRGGAPIVLATFPLMADIEKSQIMFDIVFFIVVISVLLQGRTIMPVARLLGLDKPLKSRPRVPLLLENTGNLDSSMREYDILPESPFIGKTLADAGLPKGALVLLIRRNNSYLVPRGDTELYERDTLMMLGDEQVIGEANELFGPDAYDDDD